MCVPLPKLFGKHSPPPSPGVMKRCAAGREVRSVCRRCGDISTAAGPLEDPVNKHQTHTHTRRNILFFIFYSDLIRPVGLRLNLIMNQREKAQHHILCVFPSKFILSTCVCVCVCVVNAEINRNRWHLGASSARSLLPRVRVSIVCLVRARACPKIAAVVALR